MAQPKPYNRIWQLSLLSFIIAAFTGFLYRYGMLYPLPEWLNFANIRHAHSHLMFFNWVSPPLMVLMLGSLIRSNNTNAIRSFSICLYVMLFLGFLSFPFFLLYGYHSVAIGSTSLPLAAIISGLVMITWYWFGWLWIRYRKETTDTVPLIFYDGALLTLIISSLGAWGVSIFQFTPVDSPLISSAMTHFFLAVFTEGWAVLAILGVIWTKVDLKPETLPVKTEWLWIPILIGSMLIFPYSLTESLVTTPMLISAMVGILLIVIATSLNLWFFIKNELFKGFILKTILLLIGLKVFMQVLALLPLDIWPGEHGLRVLYLHLLLLGVISILLIDEIPTNIKKISKSAFTVSVLLVLISLLFISGYWPPQFTPPNLNYWVMIFSSLPGIAAVGIFIELAFANRDLKK